MNGSPQLVVAFLAMGLLTLGVTVAIGWKRMNRGQLLVHPVRPTPRTEKKSIELGEKPTLWDLWTRKEERVTIDTRWENITPFSATLLCPIEEPAPPVLKKEFWTRPQCSSFAMMSVIRRYFRPTHLLSHPPPLESLPANEVSDTLARPKSSTISLTEGSSVMMSFTIAMPSARKRNEGAWSEAADRVPAQELLHLMELGEYCIGSMEVTFK